MSSHSAEALRRQLISVIYNAESASHDEWMSRIREVRFDQQGTFVYVSSRNPQRTPSNIRVWESLAQSGGKDKVAVVQQDYIAATINQTACRIRDCEKMSPLTARLYKRRFTLALDELVDLYVEVSEADDPLSTESIVAKIENVGLARIRDQAVKGVPFSVFDDGTYEAYHAKVTLRGRLIHHLMFHAERKKDCDCPQPTTLWCRFTCPEEGIPAIIIN